MSSAMGCGSTWVLGGFSSWVFSTHGGSPIWALRCGLSGFGWRRRGFCEVGRLDDSQVWWEAGEVGRPL